MTKSKFKLYICIILVIFFSISGVSKMFENDTYFAIAVGNKILDEGFLTDSTGDQIRFDKTLIFMTSNLEIKNKVGFVSSENGNLEEILSKELIGRFDAIVPYEKITENMVKDYIEKCSNLKNYNLEKILEESEYEKYGLRNISHIVKRMEEEYQTN